MKTLQKIMKKFIAAVLVILLFTLFNTTAFSANSISYSPEGEEVDEELHSQNNDVPDSEIIAYLSVYGYVVYDIDTTGEDLTRMVTVENGGAVAVYIRGGDIIGHENISF